MEVHYSSDVVILVLIQLSLQALDLIIAVHVCELFISLSLLLKLQEDHLFVHLVDLFITYFYLFLKLSLLFLRSSKFMANLDNLHVLFVDFSGSILKHLFLFLVTATFSFSGLRGIGSISSDILISGCWLNERALCQR